MANYSGDRGNEFLRFLDRYLGIPLLVVLGTFKKRRTKVANMKKIALLKTAAIGDTVLLSAVIKDIRENIPESEITLFTGLSNYEIAKIIAEAHKTNVIKLPVKNPLKSIGLIKQHKFDVWLDFGSWPRLDAFLSYFANADLKVGFRTRKQYRHYVYDKTVEHNKNIHELFNYKNLLKILQINGDSYPEILVPPVEKEKGLIVIHMFPGGIKSYLKEWPKEYWIELINYFTRNGYHVALTGAKSDEQKALRVYEHCKRKNFVNVVAGKLSIKETALLLKKSFLVISVNTGIMHLASALNCNLVALHGPTSSKRWGPLNKNSIAIQSPLSCSPCLNLGFEYGCNDNRCMKAISVDTVIKAAEHFMTTKI